MTDIIRPVGSAVITWFERSREVPSFRAAGTPAPGAHEPSSRKTRLVATAGSCWSDGVYHGATESTPVGLRSRSV